MRNLLFYPKLAVSGMQRNKILYVPYLLASSLMVMLFYILASMTFIIQRSDIVGGNSMALVLAMSTILCGSITILILFYLNSFVMKQRGREMGLYSVLGMGKGNLCQLLFFEIFFSFLGSLLCGIAAGAVFSQLMYLLLSNIAHLPISLEVIVPFDAVGMTAGLFLAGWVLVYLKNILSLFRSDPIRLLQNTAAGEREPRNRWFTALVGIGTLTAGYVIAVTVQSPAMALTVFLPAALLVIIATYCIFSALSILILKALRKNRRFYYKPENFIGVSGMIYRMRQNATGLANICILASAVLVTISSCVCLYVGEEDVIKSRFTRDISVDAYYTQDSSDLPGDLARSIQEHAARYDLVVEDAFSITERTSNVQQNGNDILDHNYYTATNEMLTYRLAPELSQYTGEVFTLAPDELIAYGGSFTAGETITINGMKFRIKEAIPKGDPRLTDYLRDTQVSLYSPVLFFDSTATIFSLPGDGTDSVRRLSYTYNFNIDMDHPNAQAFWDTLRNELLNKVGDLGTVSSESSTRETFYMLYGSLLFVGIFFVALFLLATVLIIYYKQITEGYDDKRRFQIMQQVGMSDREVRATIQKQVLMVFFLPILVALIHIAFAFPALVKILTLFEMYNVTLFVFCVIVSALIFLLFYTLVYFITARTYYRIVKMPESRLPI